MVSLRTIMREWGRIGIIGFGGPPTHIALLRKLCVDERGWLSAAEFEDGVAATNMLPGPASTQLAIFCAWRIRGRLGAVVGGVCFIVPGLVVILGLSAVFLASHPPRWIEGAAAGAGSAVAVVAVHASTALMPSSWRRTGGDRPGPDPVVLLPDRRRRHGRHRRHLPGPRPPGLWPGRGGHPLRSPPDRAARHDDSLPLFPTVAVAVGGIGALVWVALKVGALSYGGGFVIVPLMQHDAVSTYHWMTNAQFLNAVALGQITPGPVVQTVAVVGYAAGGLGGGLIAAAGRFRAVVSLRHRRRPPLRPTAHERRRPGLPGGSRGRRRRRHRRGGHPSRPGPGP